jgi:hypothetical protein
MFSTNGKEKLDYILGIKQCNIPLFYDKFPTFPKPKLVLVLTNGILFRLIELRILDPKILFEKKKKKKRRIFSLVCNSCGRRKN